MLRDQSKYKEAEQMDSQTVDEDAGCGAPRL